jgi:hypothetical protein
VIGADQLDPLPFTVPPKSAIAIFAASTEPGPPMSE